MKNTYKITGMTCNGCVAKVEKAINGIDGVTTAKVQLAYPQATIESDAPIDIAKTNKLLSNYGDYVIEEIAQPVSKPVSDTMAYTDDLPDKSLSTYKPLFLIVLFILGTTFLAQFPLSNGFSVMVWMRHFMAGFFIVFGFFKLLNITGFADSYAMYDIVAGKCKNWGYIYPFVEVALGVLYLTNMFPLYTNIATVLILGISSIGVIKSNLDKRKIKCACLGDVFNLPMSTVTIIEDLSMVAMAIVMLVLK